MNWEKITEHTQDDDHGKCDLRVEGRILGPDAPAPEAQFFGSSKGIFQGDLHQGS